MRERGEGKEREKVRERIREERARIASGNRYSHDDGWTQVNRRRGEKRITTFFINGLSSGCSTSVLKKACIQIPSLTDAYVPSKKDTFGKTFGFLRFENVSWPEEIISSINMVQIDMCRLMANLAKYEKEDRSSDRSFKDGNFQGPKSVVRWNGNNSSDNRSNYYKSTMSGLSYKDILSGVNKKSYEITGDNRNSA